MKYALFALLFFVAPVAAEDAKPNMCTNEMLMSYFPAPYVRVSLKKFNIPEKDWDKIVASLEEESKKVYSLVMEKASKMNPNPLSQAKDSDEAVKLYRETILSILTETFSQYGIKDAHLIDSFRADLEEQKQKQFTECLQNFEKDRGTIE